MQRGIILHKNTANRYKEEAHEYAKQVEKLLEELKDKSDSESFDDEKEKILNVKKAMEADQLKERNKVLKAELANVMLDA